MKRSRFSEEQIIATLKRAVLDTNNEYKAYYTFSMSEDMIKDNKRLFYN